MKAFLSTLALILYFSFNVSAKYTIDRIEPPFWWVGMKNTRLQLLVYGPGIADLKPHLEYPGVTLNEVIRVQNSNYIFLNLNISKETNPGSFSIEFFNKKGVEIAYTYLLNERKRALQKDKDLPIQM
ncbi:MAG: cyclomaltodextrinase N-terminal domain-containing protein [Bacteroidales bacterium]